MRLLAAKTLEGVCLMKSMFWHVLVGLAMIDHIAVAIRADRITFEMSNDILGLFLAMLPQQELHALGRS